MILFTPITITASNGQTVAAGRFIVTNTSSVDENINSITVLLSKPEIFASISLTAGNQTVTASPLAATDLFAFSPPVALPVGGAVTVNVVVTMTSQMLMADRPGTIMAGNKLRGG